MGIVHQAGGNIHSIILENNLRFPYTAILSMYAYPIEVMFMNYS